MVISGLSENVGHGTDAQIILVKLPGWILQISVGLNHCEPPEWYIYPGANEIIAKGYMPGEPEENVSQIAILDQILSMLTII